MNVSVNTAVFLKVVNDGKSQYACLQELVNKPIDNIEVRGELFKPTTKQSELKQISKLCKANNWGFYYSIPEELFTNSKLNSNIFEYLAMAEENQIKGLKISLGSFDNLDDPELIKLKDILANSNIKLTVENQPNENGKLNIFAHKLEEFLGGQPKVGYTFDSGNWYWIAEKPEDAFNKLKPFITVFHLKDILNKTTVMLGEGTTDWEKMVGELLPEVPVFLEYEIDLDQLDSEIKKVNKILK